MIALEARLSRLPAWLLPALMGGLALLVRGWAFAEQRVSNPLFRVAILDDAAYLELAARLQAGGSAEASWFLAPLYPFVLARLADLFGGPTLGLAGAISIGCGSLATVLFTICARTLHSSLAGVVSGLLHALAGTFVFHDLLPGQEPLLVLLHAAVLLVVSLWLPRGSPGWAILAGLLMGLAMLGRATSGVLAAAAVLVALRAFGPERRQTGLVGIAGLALGVLLVLGPAALRNHQLSGELTPFPWSAGPNLYLSWGPESRSHLAYRSAELGGDPRAMRERAKRAAEASEGRALRPGEVSSWWVDRALREKGTPSEAIAHAARKALLFWSQDEYGSSHASSLERDYATWTSIVPVTAWWLLALGAFGGVLARPGRPGVEVALWSGALYWLALVLFFPLSRYRLPAVALASLLAGCGLAELLLGRFAPRRLLPAAAVLLCALALSLWLARQVGPPPNPLPSVVNLGLAFLLEERAAEAERLVGAWLDRTRPAEGPADGRLLELRAQALLSLRRPRQALELLREAQLDPRSRLSAAVTTVQALIELGRDADALHGAEQVLGSQLAPPLRAEALANYALLLARAGRTLEAERVLEQAERLAPESRRVRQVARQLAPGLSL